MKSQSLKSKRNCSSEKICPIHDTAHHNHDISSQVVKSKVMFCDLLDHVGEEVMLIDSKSRIIFANEPAIKALKFPREEIIGQSIVNFLNHKISLKEWEENYYFKVKRHSSVTVILERMTAEREVQYVQVTLSFLELHHGKYILSMGRDVTENILLQKRIKDSELKYRMLSEYSGDGIILFNYKWELLYVNPEAERILKLRRYNLNGSTFKSLVDKDSFKKISDHFTKTSKDHVSPSEDFILIDSTGKPITVEAIVSRISYNGDKDCMIFVFRDITSRKHFESLIRESEKMNAIQNLITGQVKEIQMPIKGVLFKTRQVIESFGKRDFEYIGYKEYKELFDSISKINQQLQYCFDTTSKLIDLNKRKFGLKQVSVDVNTVIKESLRLVNHQLEVLVIDVKLDLAASLPKAAIGSPELNEIILNIMNNSMQSIQTGGRIVIRTSKAKGVIKIEIEDNGEGIPKEVLPHVFEPFFSTRQRGLEKNSGLGLSIVYALLQSCHGQININSTWKKGTKVTVLIPISSSESKS